MTTVTQEYRAAFLPAASIQITGSGESPEQARKDAEAQLRGYMDTLRQEIPDAVLVSFVHLPSCGGE